MPSTGMLPELATVLLGACVGIAAVLYAAPRGYLGHPISKGPITSLTSSQSLAGPIQQEVIVPLAVSTTVAEPTRAQVPAIQETVQPTPAQIQVIQETVQPTPAPVTYATPSVSPSGADSITKAGRKHQRRTTPARRTATSKASVRRKTKH